MGRTCSLNSTATLPIGVLPDSSLRWPELQKARRRVEATISIHRDLQHQLDYEGELTVIIGKAAKNVSEADALQYVLGYTNGNDLTCRYYQVPENSGGQFAYAKSFDGFAPIGPGIVTTDGVPDPQKLHYETKVNGKVRQSTGTDDMIFTIANIIAHLSRATTLQPGTVIMTGTPSGIGFFMDPQGFLGNGDVVTVECKDLGVLSSTMVFE
ncbi:hypothetical protein LTR53_010017 [Teratosphaeriaceae sp. CCFEE 6253]|nr:hypothetical protein LTR53_010017 [Teratosphaeriaceae sp. CCFEE 6253]